MGSFHQERIMFTVSRLGLRPRVGGTPTPQPRQPFRRTVISPFIEICATIISMADETNAKAFKALSDPTRLHIVEFLSRCCCGQAAVRENGDVEGPTAGEVCCHITGADRITSTVSHHLHELQGAGLIRMERKGKTAVCTLRPEGLEELAAYLRELANGGNQNGCC
jgi:DNA-binding transcriptional ArsR family regulator